LYLKSMSKFKNLFFLMLMALVMLFVIGCDKTPKIELSFSEATYTIEVGEEIPLEPVVKNDKGEEFTLVFESLDEAFVTYVDGKIKGIAVGEAKVRVSLEGYSEIFAEVTVKVKAKEIVKVIFNVDGGSAIQSVDVVKGEAVDRPTNPIKAGYVLWVGLAMLKKHKNMISINQLMHN
jgi:hypothetical protein